MSRQVYRQHRVVQRQPQHDGFFPPKNQKSRLEILGSLVFCVGLTFTKPAWSTVPVEIAAPPVSNTNSKEPIGFTAPYQEADAIPDHPKILPPEVTGDTLKEWAQPLLEEAKQSPAGEMGREEIETSFDTELRSNLVVETEAGTQGEEDARKQSSTQAQNGEPALSLGLTLLELSSQVPVTPACSLTPDLRLTSEQKLPCHSTPSSVADTEKAPNVDEVEVQPSPSENSSESQQPGSGEDPELGKLRLRELPTPPPPSKPAVYLLGGVGYFRSNNILSGIDPIDDGVFRAGLTLLATPALGPQTTLLAAVGGNINRYGELSVYDYDELNFNLGIRQKIDSRTYGEVGWSNRQLFSQDSGDRFLNDHSLYLELGRRDVLAKQLTLDTFYQLRVSMANPSDRSQVINYVGASLGYTPIPPLEVALDYQFAFADFTQQERQDHYHQLLARMSYTLTPNS
ncbi:MAG TPA: hypothetical protein V6D26_15115, partial [Stenomitos sp.]